MASQFRGDMELQRLEFRCEMVNEHTALLEQAQAQARLEVQAARAEASSRRPESPPLADPHPEPGLEDEEMPPRINSPKSGGSPPTVQGVLVSTAPPGGILVAAGGGPPPPPPPDASGARLILPLPKKAKVVRLPLRSPPAPPTTLLSKVPVPGAPSPSLRYSVPVPKV